MTQKALEDYFRANNDNPAKAAILFDGVYRRGITDLAELGFSQRITERMKADLSFGLPQVVEKLDSSDTSKLLLRMADGEYAETVLMKQSFGSCICVSTQIGCAMGCKFCQSGKLTRRRSLSPAEMVGQIIAIQNTFSVKISGVSIMGIGEPFDNFDSVRDFCDIITAGKGLEIGERHITVSTCGLVPQIYSWAEQEHPCNLAISLHAPNDELRNELMPINRRYPLAELVKAAQHFSQRLNRRVTLEYIMLDGVNDTPELAQQLADLIGDRNFYVNIIPYNPTEADCFRKSDRARIMAFYDVLKKNNIGVTMRREFGSQLKAACGQLSSDHQRGSV